MTRVLIFIGHYPPARRVGGPARSAASMVEGIPDCAFYIFTSETDFKSKTVLDGISVDHWQDRGRARVFYASARYRRFWELRRIVREIAPDVIYLNGVFARRFTMPVLLLRYLRLIPRLPVILAPRGEFSTGALGLKSVRKGLYLRLTRMFGLYRDVLWHACSGEDVKGIGRIQGPLVRIVEAANFPPVPHADALARHAQKVVGSCRLISLARIAAMKNLLGALNALAHVQASVIFDIYGPTEDPEYWGLCEARTRTLPANITVRYRNAVSPDEAGSLLAGYDALFLPTLGENYGHAVVEAWAAATPVILSDRTPWQDLDVDRAGWTTAPDDAEGFAARIDQLAEMDDVEHERWRVGALARAERLARDESLATSYARLFDTALAGRCG
jgi:glycosyltransferase involved in cell wall biosynthesis